VGCFAGDLVNPCRKRGSMQGEDGWTRGKAERRMNLLWITVRGNQLFLERVSPDRHAGEEIVERVSAGNPSERLTSARPRV